MIYIKKRIKSRNKSIWIKFSISILCMAVAASHAKTLHLNLNENISFINTLNTEVYSVDITRYKASNFSDIDSDYVIFNFKDDFDKDYQYINTEKVAVRESPDDESNVICELNYADIVVVLSLSDQSFGWTYIHSNLGDGYIKSNTFTNDVLYNNDEKEVYIKYDTFAYVDKSNPEISINVAFNQVVNQLRYNGLWSICEIDGAEYYIPYSAISESICFRDIDSTMFSAIDNLDVYIDDSCSILASNIYIKFNDEIHVIGINDSLAKVDINGQIYYIKTNDLFYIEYVTESNASTYYDNVEILNRINKKYNKEISDSFCINNDKLRILVNEYIDNAKLIAGAEATPSEIAYYCYIALMDNSKYSYNTYSAKVLKKYGVCDNSGTYRAAAILDHEIAKGACENYAAAMTAILRTLGFDAEIVGGDGAGSGRNGHYWCQVDELIFDAQVDDSKKTYGVRFGVTSDELVESGHSGYYIEETKENSSKLKLYNRFDT